jgi:very-short-patch-repair endonuclease
LQRKKTSKTELQNVAASCARWPGIERARQVIEFSDGRAESAFESISRVAFRDSGLPPPELQVRIGNAEWMIGRADFLWREHRTIGEADGALKYENPDRGRLQLRRDADLRAAGFEVVHFTWREVDGTPEAVVSSIRDAFRRAAILRGAERRGA